MRYDLYERSFQIKSQTRLNPFDSSEISMNAVLTHQDGENRKSAFMMGRMAEIPFTPTRTGTYRYECCIHQGTAAEKVFDGDFTVLPEGIMDYHTGQKIRRFSCLTTGTLFPTRGKYGLAVGRQTRNPNTIRSNRRCRGKLIRI